MELLPWEFKITRIRMNWMAMAPMTDDRKIMYEISLA